MQHQIKRPGFPVGGVQIPKPKDLLSQVPDVSRVLAPKPKTKRTVTRCGGCSDPNCRQIPVTVEIDD